MSFECLPPRFWRSFTDLYFTCQKKNLPNRKKIGKQDPYAVARLGKEGKRTDTDVRGGQTPRWWVFSQNPILEKPCSNHLFRDKELRFPVRNSPDYRTLKITVFNDDKKTDLIGECSLRLDRILVAGGGTDDGWRGLKCKDKYAGEILVELTFWDMRPTPEQTRKSEETAVYRERERDEKKERDVPRKIGGAREMGFREKATKRRPLPSDPSHSREDLNQPSQPAPEPVRAIRKSRHPHQLQPQIHQTHHSHSEPPRAQRESRGSSSRPISFPTARGIAVTPIGVNLGNGIYDPYGQDNYIPGVETFGRYNEPEDRDPHGQFEPPPPPVHSRSYQPDGRHHSSTSIATQLVLPSQQRSSQHQRQKSQLRHYQSVPDWQFYQQQHTSIEQRDQSQRDDYDPRDLEQYGSSYPGPQHDFLPHEGFDDRPSTKTRASRHPNLPKQTSYDGGMRYEDEAPSILYGPTPSNSLASLRNNDHDAPPPPPPPHARKPVPIHMEELNWQNSQQHHQLQDQRLGLPSYDDLRSHGIPQNELSVEARVPSRGIDMSPTRNGVPLPPSLVPGIDPAVAEQMSERIENERRLSFNGAAEPPNQLQIEAGPRSQSRQMQHVPNRNYHRPQVEEVQDVALYQPQLLPEDQVVERSVKKKQRSAPMVKPTPIHGDRDESAAGATASITKRNSMVVPERKPLPPPEPKPLEGLPFSPDSFNVINPGPAVEAEAKKPKKMTLGTKKVLDATDILPPESFAPEPELKKRTGNAPPPVSENHRKERLRRSLSPLPPKKAERLALPAPPPPVPKRESRTVVVEAPKERERERERNKLQKKLRNSQSMAIIPNKSGPEGGSNRNRYSVGPGTMVMYNPESERQRQKDTEKAERERAERDSRALVPASGHENYGYKQQSSSRYTGMEIASYAPTSGRSAPAKIPLQSGHGAQLSREDYLLSQEMSLINIGPLSGGRTRRGAY